MKKTVYLFMMLWLGLSSCEKPEPSAKEIEHEAKNVFEDKEHIKILLATINQVDTSEITVNFTDTTFRFKKFDGDIHFGFMLKTINNLL